MRDGGISELVASLVASDVTALDSAEINDVVAGLRRVQGWVDVGLVECTRRLTEISHRDRPHAGAPGSRADVGAVLTGYAGQSGKEARATQERSDLCGRDSEFENVLASGDVTAHHLDLIARARKRLGSEAQLADFDARLDEIRAWAVAARADEFELQLRQLVAAIRSAHRPTSDREELEQQRAASTVKDWVDRQTGMRHILLSADPIRAAKILSAHRAELAALRARPQRERRQPWGSLQIDAFVAAVSGGEAASRSAEVVVVIDHESLTTGKYHEQSRVEAVDGTSLPISFVQQLCCDATLTFATTDDRGVIYDTIERRTASRRQRRALAAMYRTCAFPGCTVPFSDTRAHHIIYASRGGPTNLDNLLPLCEQHHHCIHDHDWKIRLDTTTREATFTSPSGQRHRSSPQHQSAATKRCSTGSPVAEHATMPVDYRHPQLC